jgi:hypothetical protein
MSSNHELSPLPGMSGAPEEPRVDHPGRVGPQVRVDREHSDDPLERWDRVAKSFLVPGLAGQVAERSGHVPGYEAQPTGLRPHAQQDLGHGQGEQLGVGQLRGAIGAGWPSQVIVDLDVECGQKGVQAGPHKLILNTLRPYPDTTST